MSPTFVSRDSPVQSDTFDAYLELRRLLNSVGVDIDKPGVSTIDIQGRDPLVETGRFRYGATAALPAIAVAVIAAQIHYLRTGQSQDVSVDLRTAYHNHSISGEHEVSSNMRLDRESAPTKDTYIQPTLAGKRHNKAILPGNPFLHDCYPTRDGRYIVPVAVYLEHRLQWYSLLNISPYPVTNVRKAILQWDAKTLEEAAVARGLPAAMVQTAAEWSASDVGQHMLSTGPIPISRIADTGVKGFPPIINDAVSRPLSGIKVLMATHAIAGPSAGRVLAEHGARVLQVFRPELGFEHEAIYNEANVGCKSTQLDLSGKVPSDMAKFWELIAEADAFIESFAPEALSKYGITDRALTKANPNIIICHTKCYGTVGPWASRKGHDQNASASVGLLHALAEHKAEFSAHSNVETGGLHPNGHTNGVFGQAVNGNSDAGELTPVWPEPSLVNDFTTGLFGAMGVAAALLKRATVGGAYTVSPALAQTSSWYVHQLGTVPKDVFESVLRDRTEEYTLQAPRFIVGRTPKGVYRRQDHMVKMSGTPLHWEGSLINCQGAAPPSFAW